jgi:hypothetical protein
MGEIFKQKKITTYYKALTLSLPLYILILFIAFQNLYSQEADSTTQYFPSLEDFNERPHFNIQVDTLYNQFPSIPCNFVLFDADTSYAGDFVFQFQGQELNITRGTKIVFKVTNLDEIWCRGSNDKWINIRYLE